MLLEELQQRFETAIAGQGSDVNDVKAGKQYVQAMLGFVLYAHHLFEFVKDRELGENNDGKKNLDNEKRRSEIIKKARRLGHKHHTETAV